MDEDPLYGRFSGDSHQSSLVGRPFSEQDRSLVHRIPEWDIYISLSVLDTIIYIDNI